MNAKVTINASEVTGQFAGLILSVIAGVQVNGRGNVTPVTLENRVKHLAELAQSEVFKNALQTASDKVWTIVSPIVRNGEEAGTREIKLVSKNFFEACKANLDFVRAGLARRAAKERLAELANITKFVDEEESTVVNVEDTINGLVGLLESA